MRLRTGSALLLLTASSLAQSPQEPVQKGQQPPAPYTIKATTQRVLIDVIVKDKHGNPVHGLKQSDFTVTENKTPQDIRNFDEHTGLTAGQASATPHLPPLPPGQFSNLTAAPQNGTLNIILIDRLNTSQTDQVYLRQQFLKYLDHARPDAQTAIFALTDHLFVLQGFSANPAILRNALEAVPNSKASPLRDDTLGNAGKEDLASLTDVLTRAGQDENAAAAASFQAQYQSFQQQISSKYTLDALNQIGRALVNVPGRKNLIWFAGNFPADLFPGDNDPNLPLAQFASLDNEYRDTIDLLTSSQVAIYPVDAQGLRTLNRNTASEANPAFAQRTAGQRAPASVTDSFNESSGIAREHLGMTQIAFDTGGEASYNTNNLAKSVDDAIASGSNYYTLAYAPSNSSQKPDFRSISVEVPGQSYKLTYRHGYYTAVARKPAQKITATGIASAAQPPSPSALRRALLQGGPEPTEILLRVKAAPTGKGPDATLAQGNTPNPDQSKSAGPYQQFQVDFATSARALSFAHGPDNLYHADLSFVTYVYDLAGVLINAQTDTIRTSYTPKTMLEVLHGGVPFTQQISVPLRGANILRIAVHDNLNDKVGAVEIPVAAIRDLPIPAPAAAADIPAPKAVSTP